MNDIYDIFPKDIWILIILELPCKFIYNLYDVSYKFKELCDEKNIIEKRKLKGYPRKSGYCKSYGAYNYKGNVYNNNGDIIDNGLLKVVMKNIRFNPDLVKLTLNDTLDRLYEDNTDLVRGDLIYFEMGDRSVFLFDGEKIIDTCMKGKNILSKDMDIINDNLQSEYWRGIRFGFNFNTCLVKEQLLNNIKHNNDTFASINHTIFMLNDKTYTILFPKNLSLLKIKEKLNNDKLFLTMSSMFGPNTFACE